MSIGDTLAAARRQAGLTVTQVSQRTCIRETIIRGIERDDYSACGGDFYARGHIRSIARAIGVDPDELVREYDATRASRQQLTAAQVFQPFTPVRLKERRKLNWFIVMVAAAVVVVLGLAGFKFFGPHSTPPAKPIAATHTDHPTQPTQPTHSQVTQVVDTPTPSPPQIRITLVALTGSITWAGLHNSTGHLLFQGDIGQPNGPQRKTWIYKHPITLRLGNPGGAVLYLNGKRQPLITNQPETLVCTTQTCTQTSPQPTTTPGG